MINALGLLEVSGLVAGIDAADAMLKAADVRVLNHQVISPGWVTLVIEGDLAACRAALDAGVAAASRTGTVISRKEIGRPDPDIEEFVLELRGVRPKAHAVSDHVEDPKQVPATEENDAAWPLEALLAEIASHAQGMTVGEVAARYQLSLKQSKYALEGLLREGKLRKRGSRYRVKAVNREVGHE
ncbi:BMC domain-containing protein [Yersinia intermedia]|uniref:BMC domain-containing protein n=1 Tax=Yersinia intermedia TaxID=631 RepID=UPI0022FF36C7|nr:BMC domain-containing protein [Yersinia intermedia]MDA5482760.1 BMC domain-containing protein [Yersinia intermedia]